MPNDFLQQFMAGWQMGQGRNENMRRNQELQMEQQRQAMMAQQRAEEMALRQQEFAVRKKALAAEEAAHKLDAAKQAYDMKSQAASLSNLPPPTAQDIGVPQQGPDMAGPPVNQINVPQPVQEMPNPMEGQPSIQMPVLTGPQQQMLSQAEQQKKMREALGLVEGKAQIEAQYREPKPTLQQVFAEAKARAAGTRAGNPIQDTGSDPGLEAVANGLANYEIGLSDLGRMPQGAKAAVFAKAKQLNPEFNASLYASRQKLRADFTSGKTANNIDSLNTAVDHIGALATYGDALKNGNVQLANQAAQSFATATGNPAPTNYQTMATAVESEVASLLKKTGATDQEISSWRSNFNKNMSPAQLKGAVGTVLKVMEGRENALQQRWKTGMGTKQDYPIYGEEQMSVLNSLGYRSPVKAAPATSKYKIIEVK